MRLSCSWLIVWRDWELIKDLVLAGVRINYGRPALAEASAVALRALADKTADGPALRAGRTNYRRLASRAVRTNCRRPALRAVRTNYRRPALRAARPFRVLTGTDWGLTKVQLPGFNLEGLRNWAGMRPAELGVWPEAKGRRRGAQNVPGEAQKESLRLHAVGDEARPHPKGRARSRGGKAVIRVRQRRNNTRAGPHFAVCLTLPGRQGWGLTDAAPGEAQEESLKIHAVGDEARPHPNPLPQERELTDVAPGEARELAEAPIKANQTKSNQIKPAGGEG